MTSACFHFIPEGLIYTTEYDGYPHGACEYLRNMLIEYGTVNAETFFQSNQKYVVEMGRQRAWYDYRYDIRGPEKMIVWDCTDMFPQWEGTVQSFTKEFFLKPMIHSVISEKSF
mgnify:CR=1 FL=1